MPDPIEAPAAQGLTLYSHHDDHYSHRVRLAIAEKQLPHQLILLDAADDDLAQLNPYATLPMLIDSSVRLFHPATIIEYLDERYRQQRLFADHPVQRAEQRQLIWRIERDWFAPFDILLRHPDSADDRQQHHARQQLQDILATLAPLFGHMPYFMSEQYSIVDCTLAPLFYRLPVLQLMTTGKHWRGLMLYCQRLFRRDAFVRSLTPHEQRRYPELLSALSAGVTGNHSG